MDLQLTAPRGDVVLAASGGLGDAALATPASPSTDTPTMPRTKERRPTIASIERARGRVPRARWVMPRPFLIDATHATFAIEGIAASLEQVARAISHRQQVRAFRSPLSHRIRAHASILRCVERLISSERPLRAGHVARWYAGLSAGLPTAPVALAGGGGAWLGTIVARLNAYTPRVPAAIAEAVDLYATVLRDPVVPAYNGIVARLMLNLQLGRSGLLPVIVDPATTGDGPSRSAAPDEEALVALLARRYELAGAL